jgi:ankyrin repeat protein
MGRNIHKKTKEGWTCLMYAVLCNEYEIAKILLANGSDANEKNENGISAKTIAAEHNLEEMKLLLEKH